MAIPRIRRCLLGMSLVLVLISTGAYGRSVFLASPERSSMGGAHVQGHAASLLARLYPGNDAALGDLEVIIPDSSSLRLNKGSSIAPRSLSSSLATINHVNGAAAEGMMHMYYSGQGWKPIDRIGSQGIDGLFYRVEPNGRLRVLIAESKSGTSRLGKTLTKGHQMSHEWILKSLDEQIAKYQKRLLKVSREERTACAEQIRLLQRIRRYVEIRDYRTELFRADVKNGMLEVHFSRLAQTHGGEAPRIDHSKVKTRKVDLTHPESLKGSNRQVYDRYFEFKKQELLKRMDERYAQRVIDDLKKEYIRNPSMGLREERVFLQARLEQHQARKVAQAIVRKGGRLVRHMPTGWQRTAMSVLKKGAGAAGKTYAAGGRVLSRGLVVVDIATNVYFTYGDYGRWKAGEIDVEYLGFKAGLRTAQSALTVYALAAPDVSMVTKVATGTAAVLLMVADVASDPFYEAARERRRELLTQVDQFARIDICRMRLLAMVDSALANNSG